MSPSQIATLNLEEARRLRASGSSYRQISRQLNLSACQLGYIRRALKREKAATTRLRSKVPGATDRDLPVGQSVLPLGLRKNLIAAGYHTLGDLADLISDPTCCGLRSLAGIGPHKAELVTRLLDHHGVLSGADDLLAAIGEIFPEYIDPGSR